VSNCTFETEIIDIDRVNHFISLALAFPGVAAEPFTGSYFLSFFSSSDETIPIQDFEIHSPVLRGQDVVIFKTHRVDYSRIKAVIRLSDIHFLEPLMVVWEFGHPLTFAFLSGVKLVALVGSLPVLFVIYRKLSMDGVISLSYSQWMAYGLVFSSFFYYDPVNAFFLNHPLRFQQIFGLIAEDLFVAFFFAYSILIFVPFLKIDLTEYRIYIVPYFLSLFSLTFSVANHAFGERSEKFIFLAQSGLRPGTSVAEIFILGLYFLTLSIFTGLAFRQVLESNRYRFWYFTGLNAISVVAISAYSIVAKIFAPYDQNALYEALPTIGVFLYASLMFHGHQDTEVKPVFESLAPPEDVDFQEDNAMGLDVND
jgi:hypothetical protein